MVQTQSLGQVPTLFHIEDDWLVADHISKIFMQWSEIQHIGFATNGEDGLSICRLRRPEIVLLDLRLPDADGFAVADKLNALPHPPHILLLSGRADESTLFRAWSGRVAGLIWKTPHCIEQLRAAIGTIANERRYFPPEVLTAMRHFRGQADAFFKILSDCEMSLVEALARGKTDSEIAVETGVSSDTIHTHRRHIMAKLGLHRASDITWWALCKGLSHVPASSPPCIVAE